MSDTHKYLDGFLKNIRNEYEKARTAVVGGEKYIQVKKPQYFPHFAEK